MKKLPHSPSHTARAIVVSCIDFRFQDFLTEWTKKTFKKEGFDRVALAGGVKNLPFVIDQVDLSHKLHHIKEVYLINHEDCGAYGKEGNFQKHKKDLLKAKDEIAKKIPSLKVFLLYLTLSGKFQKV
ncbi:hypothetical protein A3D77_07835 [Candidatus Gottesmanbacteria bacterium RIFCSPHIGHO2_02_FULL_39_11]|uniref:Carbonic anhydrase n=1 Tax=Candidatus Gottesmanbacteria bacterium RIFCSPHIGHO2_02_FULL_39_11 TaxID=1798382 RepID=A0A1F5ZTU7_9BACT|nr:MAG: hypothetical protein A3D77_07835 [Candidatus Gottesmanbacteria bacterium RIFCSPHIGHO2_02_FULL_39_11]